MKAIVCPKFGPPDVLKLEEIETPTPQENEVLVKIHASSLNSMDVEILRGKMLHLMRKPRFEILGTNIAGKVHEIGKNIKNFQEGDEVFEDTSLVSYGAFAEYVCVPEEILRKYSTASGEEKDSLMNSYRSILKTKSNRFSFAMVGWAIGTLAFSNVLVAYALVIPFIGWLGIVASILIGFANVMVLFKPDVNVYETLSSISDFLTILFEILIGISLLFFPPIIS